MCLIIFLVIYIVATEFASAASIFDQSQTGDINVQIDLKDLQIIALTKSNKEEYVDYDYAYDYSEMTIKPQNGTTQKPLNVTSSTGANVFKDNTTISTTAYADITTESIKNSTLESVSSVEVTNITAFTTEKNVQTTTANTAINKIDIISAANATNGCTRGYVRCDSQQAQQSKPLSWNPGFDSWHCADERLVKHCTMIEY